VLPVKAYVVKYKRYIILLGYSKGAVDTTSLYVVLAIKINYLLSKGCLIIPIAFKAIVYYSNKANSCAS
jgi:hypothetical protein